jgi:GDPmannose 4,6-dehydratase
LSVETGASFHTHKGHSLKKALITGITGQDGSYLAEWLLTNRYEVHGIIRPSSTANTERIAHLAGHVHLHQADLLDQGSLIAVIQKVDPVEVYNLGAMSSVPSSWQQPILAGEFTALGVTRVLEAIRLLNPQGIRFYQASSSEMFGKAQETPQRETTPFYPRSPYGVAKTYGHWITVNYRESYGMFCCSGILFNHESCRRGREFVTRKVTDAVARIKLGLQTKLPMGNLKAKRDWGYAGDYVKAMWLMLQQEKPDNFVVATGEAHSVEELLGTAFSSANLDWKDHVIHDPLLMRPAEVNSLVGDPSKSSRILGWRPEVGFKDLIRQMVKADLERVTNENSLRFDEEAPTDKQIFNFHEPASSRHQTD